MLSRLPPILVGFLTVFIAVGCHRGKSAPQGGSDVPPSKVNLGRVVELSIAQQTNLVYHVETVGMVEAEGQTELAVGVPGSVEKVNFREGQIVDPTDPQPLVVVSERLYRAAVLAANAEVARAETRLNEAQKNWKLIEDRLQSVSESEQLSRRTALKVTEAELEIAKAAQEKANFQFTLSQRRAPYRAQINRKLVDPGDQVDEKTVVATMANLSRMRIVGFIPETATAALRDLMNRRDRAFPAVRELLVRWKLIEAGDRSILPHDLNVDFDPDFNVLSDPARRFRARIFSLSTVGDPATHQFECKAQIDLPIDGPPLLPGYTARIRVPLQTRKDAVLVHEESLRNTEHGHLVFVPERRVGRDGKTEWLAKAVPVEPGYRNKGMVEIRGGLKGGEIVIKKGADALDEDGGTPLKLSEEQLRTLEKVTSH